MNRRTFMKAVGVVLVGAASIASVQPALTFLGVPTEAQLKFPTMHPKRDISSGVSYYVRFKCNKERYFELLECLGSLNDDFVAFKEEGKLTHYHPARGIIFSSLRGEGPRDAILAVAEFKNRYLEETPEFYDFYRTSDFAGLLKCNFIAETKEAVSC